MSMERGFVHWHGDVDCTDRALEAGLGFACKKVEDYLGRAAVEKMRSKGITRETEIKRILFRTNSSAEYSANYSVKLFGHCGNWPFFVLNINIRPFYRIFDIN